jgi:acyl carrier protein
VFRLEKGFGVKIPRGKIVEDARGPLPESQFENKGVVTEAGMARLREFLGEVPADRFKTPMKAGDVPRLFTTETFCKVVIRAQRAAQA